MPQRPNSLVRLAIVGLLAAPRIAAGAEASLVDAVKQGDRILVQALMRRAGVDVNAPSPDGTSAPLPAPAPIASTWPRAGSAGKQGMTATSTTVLRVERRSAARRRATLMPCGPSSSRCCLAAIPSHSAPGSRNPPSSYTGSAATRLTLPARASGSSACTRWAQSIPTTVHTSPARLTPSPRRRKVKALAARWSSTAWRRRGAKASWRCSSITSSARMRRRWPADRPSIRRSCRDFAPGARRIGRRPGRCR